MMNSGGIGSLLQNKVDAYRGQPEKLANSYQQNQQLIDLLALQKIKSDKEAAMRQMQLDMAKKHGTPPTVAAQREQEVMDLTKNEIAQQSQIGGQQIAAQQQDAMSGGIASQPAPNMTQMAGGGIVGFAEGGRARATKEQEDEVLAARKVQEALRAAGRKGRFGAPFFEPPEKLRGQEYDPTVEEVAESGAERDPMEAEIDIQAMLGEDVLPYEQPEAPVPTRSRIEDSDFAAPPAAVTQPPVQAAPAEKTGIAKLLEEAATKQLGADPEAAATAAGTRYRDLTRNPEAEANRQSIQDQLEAQYAKQNDPKRQAREQLSAFLRGGANRSGIGSVLAGASEASSGVRGAQDAAKVTQLKEAQAYYDARVKELQTLGLGQIEAEQMARQEASQLLRAGMQTGAEITRQESAAAEGAADRASREGISANEIAANKALRESLASMEVQAELQKAAQMAGVKSQEEYLALVADLVKQAGSDITLMTQIQANPEQQDQLLSDWVAKHAAIFDVMAGTVQAR